MTTYLDALAELVTDASARIEYRRDPAGWLAGKRVGGLCGEDVVAAEPLLRQWFGPDLPVTPRRRPDPAPRPGEPEAASAIRQIDHLLAGFAAGDGVDPGSP